MTVQRLTSEPGKAPSNSGIVKIAALLDKPVRISSIPLTPTVVDLANKTRFREHILSNRPEELIDASTYGDRLLPELSRALTAEFGKGFSLANLKNFRKFNLTFPEREKSYTLCSL